MGNLRNTKEFRDEIITALGGDPNELDTENELNFRGGMLQALGIEYEPSDLTNFEAWRTKLVEAAGSAGGGGGDYPTITETRQGDTSTYTCDWEYSKIRNAIIANDRSIAGIFIDPDPGSQGGSWWTGIEDTVVLTLADGSRLIYHSNGEIEIEF